MRVDVDLRGSQHVDPWRQRAQNSWKGCVHSVLGCKVPHFTQLLRQILTALVDMHNETINIHSHLFGAILFVVFLAMNYSVVVSSYTSTTWVDTAMVSIFLTSAVFCLSSSSIFHIMVCHSEDVCGRDYHTFKRIYSNVRSSLGVS